MPEQDEQNAAAEYERLYAYLSVNYPHLILEFDGLLNEVERDSGELPYPEALPLMWGFMSRYGIQVPDPVLQHPAENQAQEAASPTAEPREVPLEWLSYFYGRNEWRSLPEALLEELASAGLTGSPSEETPTQRAVEWGILSEWYPDVTSAIERDLNIVPPRYVPEDTLPGRYIPSVQELTTWSENHSPYDEVQRTALNVVHLYPSISFEQMTPLQRRIFWEIVQNDEHEPTLSELHEFNNKVKDENDTLLVSAGVRGESFSTLSSVQTKIWWLLAHLHLTRPAVGFAPSPSQLRYFVHRHPLNEEQKAQIRDYMMPNNLDARNDEQRRTTWDIYNNHPVPPYVPSAAELQDWLEYHTLSSEQIHALTRLAERSHHLRLLERSPEELEATWRIYQNKIPEEYAHVPEAQETMPTTDELEHEFREHANELGDRVISRIRRRFRIPIAEMAPRQRSLLQQLLHEAINIPQERKNYGRLKNPNPSDVNDWLSRHRVSSKQLTLLNEIGLLDAYGRVQAQLLNPFERRQAWAILHNRKVPERKLTRHQQLQLEHELEGIPYASPEVTPEEQRRNQFLNS